MNEKGFTLIELLAVIVILAIIALIATPIVLSIISDSKESASLRSAEMYLDAVEYGIADTIMNNKTISNGSHTVMENGNICIGTYSNKTCTGEIIEVKVKGETPKEGSIITIEEGKIKDVNLLYGDKTIIKNSNDSLIFLKSLDELCEYVDSGVAEKTIGAKYTCDLGSEKRNFYVLEIGTNPVSNTTLEENEVALILEGNYDTTTQAWCDQNGANPDTNECAADGLSKKLDEIARVWTKVGRNQLGIPSGEQIMVANGLDEDAYKNLNTVQGSTWLYNWPDKADYGNSEPYGYWLSSYYTGTLEYAYYVYVNGILYAVHVNNSFIGIRPFIILKI